MKSIGVDVGGTETKIAVVDDLMRTVYFTKVQTPLKNGYSGFVTELGKILTDIACEYKVIGIGFAIAGDVDSVKGILRFAPNLCGWKNKNIKSDFEEVCGVRVMVENDANMAVWGAYMLNFRKKYNNICGFTLGTGIGGGIIINGKLHLGSTTTAGEFGHMVIREKGLKCACGNRGCLEAYCSTARVIKLASLKIKGIMTDKITPKLVYELARKGNKAAKDIWYDYGRYLGYGISNIAVILNPQAIILTGGLSGAWEFFKDGIRETLDKYGIKKPIDMLKIHVISSKNLGVIGSALYLMEMK